MIDMCTLDATEFKEKFVREKKLHFVAIEFIRNKINFTNNAMQSIYLNFESSICRTVILK
jgi:hypothetical protein